LAERNLLPRSEWRKRQETLERGLNFVPDDAELHIALAFDLAQVGRLNEAVTIDRRALELDPLSPGIRASFVQSLSNSGRIAEAEKELQKGEKIWPSSKLLADARYAFDMRFGDASNALRMIRESSVHGTTLGASIAAPNPGVESFLLARIDPNPANIDKAIGDYMVRFRQDPAGAGSMLLSLGAFNRIDQFYSIANHPVVLRNLPQSTEALFRHYMRGVRHDPRFMPLAARLGLVRYWTEADKWPDFCFDTDLPYDCKAEAAKLKAAGRLS
jgi:tetratricopeptide (TPR) repeat protein